MSTWDTDLRRPPNDGALDDLPQCKNCGCDFSEHMQDGEPLYMCPPDCQMGCVYGFFHGGDPRNFHPDCQDSSEVEIENHRKACELANRLESEGKPIDLECPSGWVYDDAGKPIMHLLRAPFGIGVSTYPPTCYEPRRQP